METHGRRRVDPDDRDYATRDRPIATPGLLLLLVLVVLVESLRPCVSRSNPATGSLSFPSDDWSSRPLFKGFLATQFESLPPSCNMTSNDSVSVTSTTPLGTSAVPQKDYAAALAILQSKYGTTGHIPGPTPKSETSSKHSDPRPTFAQSTHAPFALSSDKDDRPPESHAAKTTTRKGLLYRLKRVCVPKSSQRLSLTYRHQGK
jgi:hypothetical protein